MEAAMLILVMIIGLVALGGAALNWGANTRERYPDDHIR